MEFGDRKTFAVVFELDENHSGAWLYGKFCYWINGVQVGDYELGTSLRDVLLQMKWIVHDCGKRDGGILCALDAQEVFSRLDARLYGENEPVAPDQSQLPHTPARFEITIPVDVFDQWKAFLIECGNDARILFKSIDAAVVKVATIPIGIFDDAITKAFHCLDKLYEAEAPPNT